MKRQYIPVGEAFEEWRKDPEYVLAYDAREAEFALASVLLIKARGDAHLTPLRGTRSCSQPPSVGAPVRQRSAPRGGDPRLLAMVAGAACGLTPRAVLHRAPQAQTWPDCQAIWRPNSGSPADADFVRSTLHNL